MTILCDLLAYTGSVSTLNPAKTNGFNDITDITMYISTVSSRTYPFQ